ncbi:MAG: hypothetical protein K2G47_07955, partial [Muribaculum sp.]|nr:hypothetical protein [Muribaculum sp.]
KGRLLQMESTLILSCNKKVYRTAIISLQIGNSSVTDFSIGSFWIAEFDMICLPKEKSMSMKARNFSK